MCKGYPIGTQVTVGGIEYVISAVAFYPEHEKYLLFKVDDGKITEDWFSSFYFKVGNNQKNIGFEV